MAKTKKQNVSIFNKFSENSFWKTSRDIIVNHSNKRSIKFISYLPIIVEPVHFFLDFSVLPLCHDFFEICYIIDGECSLLVNSKEYIIKNGDIFFMNNIDLHTLIIKKNAVNTFTLFFLPEVIYKPSSNDFNLDFLRIFYFRSNKFNHVLKSSSITEDIFKIMIKLHNELKDKNSYYEITSINLLQEILLILLKKFSTELHKSNKIYYKNYNDLEKLKVILKMIEKNYYQVIKLEDAAKEAGYSVGYFCRLFKQVIGITFVDYVLKFRIDKAKQLLFNSNFSILEIAYEVGFNNISNFYRIFKKFTFMSPDAFRKKILG